MSINIDIKLKRASKIYHEAEVVTGLILLKTNSDVKHDGIFLTMEGSVNLQLSSKNVGIFEAFYNSVKPIQLIQYTLDVAPSGKIPSGKTEIPFELPLKPRGNKSLYETYHGVFVNIQYLIRCDIKRNFLAKDVSKSLEFIVEDKPNNKMEKEHSKIVFFKIMPESLQNARDRTNVPKFCISGRLDTLHCKISEPLTGEVVVENSEATIKSIELQLVRVETCGCAEGYSRDDSLEHFKEKFLCKNVEAVLVFKRQAFKIDHSEHRNFVLSGIDVIMNSIWQSELSQNASKVATEIQNIQIGEGNVCTNFAIPIYMIFPRLFTCPTLSTSNFKVEFEVNLIVVFEDDYLVTENFPIILSRY